MEKIGFSSDIKTLLFFFAHVKSKMLYSMKNRPSENKEKILTLTIETNLGH